MTDKNPTQTTPDAPSTDDNAVELNRLQKFVLNRPRAAKAVAIIGGAIAVVGTATVANTMRKNQHHLEAAADEAKGALTEFSNAVSPSPETDA